MPSRLRVNWIEKVWLSALLCSAFCFSLPPGDAADRVRSEADSTIQLETEELPHYLDFKGSALNPITRIKVTYSKQYSPSGSIYYEELWYRGANVLGSRRYSNLNVQSQERVRLRIINKSGSGSIAENSAAANCAIRIWLEARGKGAIPQALYAPQSAFGGISDGLQRLSFRNINIQPNVPISAPIMIKLYSEPEGAAQTFAYAG